MQDIEFRAVDDVGIRMPPIYYAARQLLDNELLAHVERTAGMMRAAGLIAAAQELTADPSNKLAVILDLLKNLVFARMQHTIDTIVVDAPKLGCKKGCSHCCHLQVEATIPEAILAFAHVADPADPRRRTIAETAALLAGLDENARMLSRTRCPMLRDGSCSIYEARPLLCRATFATEPEQCRVAVFGSSTQTEASIEFFANAQLAAYGDQAAMRGILKDMGLQYNLVNLTQAVAAMIEDPSIVTRWLSGGQVFGPDITLAEIPGEAAVA